MRKKREKCNDIGQERQEADRKNSIYGQEMGIATHWTGHSDQKGWRQAERTFRQEAGRIVACADRK